MKNVVIKKSKINGKGVFAAKYFKKGEIILRWKPKFLKKYEIENCSDENLHYAHSLGGRIILMRSPEKYVNHSCEANTTVADGCDVAIRNIKKGEEITSDYTTYTKEFEGEFKQNFQCKCGSKKCKKFI